MAWTPDGYYTSSVNGDNFVGWHLNRGRDLAPDFYRAVQFDRVLYRPDVVADTFRLALAGSPSTSASVRQATFQISQLRDIAPPRLRLVPSALQGLAEGRPRATLRLEGEKNALDIRDYAVFVNGIPVTPSRERTLSGADAARFSRTVDVDLPARANDIRVEAFNGVSMGIAETHISLPADVQPSTVAGKPVCAGHRRERVSKASVEPEPRIRRAGCRGDGGGARDARRWAATPTPSSRCCPTVQR